MLKALEIPRDTPRTITCQACQRPMRWHRINKHAGFWLHQGGDIDYCAGRNPMHPGKPLIAQNLHFYRTVGGVWKAYTDQLKGEKKHVSEDSEE